MTLKETLPSFSFVGRIAKDKQQHFVAGLLLSLFGLVYLPLISLGFIYGVGKEISDHFKGKFDVIDILYTFAGAGVALGIVIPVKFLLS